MVYKFRLVCHGFQNLYQLTRIWTHFTNKSWVRLRKIMCCLTWKIIFRSGHNFAYATAAELLWFVQYCDLIRSLQPKIKVKWIFTRRFQLWVHNLFVKWFPTFLPDPPHLSFMLLDQRQLPDKIALVMACRLLSKVTLALEQQTNKIGL